MAIMNVLAELHQEHDLKVTNPKITFAKKITAETKLIKNLMLSEHFVPPFCSQNLYHMFPLQA